MGKKSRWRRQEATEESEGVSSTAAEVAPASKSGEAESERGNLREDLFKELMERGQRQESLRMDQQPTAATSSSGHRQDQRQSAKTVPPGSGQAHFPVMTAEEVAELSLPATSSAEELRQVFEKHGVLIVTDVLSEEECALMEKLFLEDLLNLVDLSAPMDAKASETIARLREEGLRAWPLSWSKEIGFKGTASQRGMPHGWFAWAARLHPRVREVFQKIYGVSQDDLAVGLDVSFFSANEAEPASSNKEWLHVDQNHRTGMTWECAQGVLYIWPSLGDASSCTVAWPGSHHLEYSQMMNDTAAAERGRNPGGQSVHVNLLHNPSLREELIERATVQGLAKRLPCPAGSLLLWDSRVIHQGWAGGPRLAQPVCWEPRFRRKPAALHRKRYICGTAIATSHSAAEGRIHGMCKYRANASKYEEGRPFFKRCITPFCVQPDQEDVWRQLQDQLWGPDGDPRKQINRFDSSAVQAILRPEVEAAL